MNNMAQVMKIIVLTVLTMGMKWNRSSFSLIQLTIQAQYTLKLVIQIQFLHFKWMLFILSYPIQIQEQSIQKALNQIVRNEVQINKMVKLLKLLVLIFTLALKQIVANYISVYLSVDNTQINSQTSYTFNFFRNINPLTSDFVTPTTIPINSIIQIVYPNDYPTLALSTIVPCTDAQTGLALNCQVFNINKTVTVKNYYSDSSKTGNLYPLIKISSIINPKKSGQTANFVYYIRDPIGNIIDQSPSATNTVYFPRLTFTPGSFKSCRISAQGATILTRSKLYVTLSPKNQISSSGKIVLEFPLKWANDIQNSQTIITSPTCAAIANMSQSLSCQYRFETSPVNKAYVTISGLTNSTLSTSFSFSVQAILTPPFVDSSELVVISSQWSDGSQIDKCSTTISEMTAIKFQSATFDTTTQKMVQSPFSGRLSLSIAKPFHYEDKIILSMPQYFLNASITTNAFSRFSQSKDSSSSAITLSNFPSTSSKSTNTVLNFTLQNLLNPISVKPVSVIVSFYRLDSLYQQSTIQYTAISGISKVFKIAPLSTFVNTKGNAQLQIQSTLSVPLGAKIKISYPATVTAEDVVQTPVISAKLNGISVPSSQFSVSINTIVLTNIFSRAFANGTILVDFPQFQSPPTIQPSQYLLTVQTSDGFNIFTGSQVITSTLKGLIKNQVLASTYKVLATSVLSLNVELNFLASVISVIVPDDVLIRPGFETSCLPNSLSACYLAGNNLTFQGNFQPGPHTLSWGNVQNPNSFQPSQTFSIFTYNRGWGTQKSLGYIYLQMNQTNTFSSMQVIPSSLKNNQLISVALTINFPTNKPSQGQFLVVFPQEIDVSGAICSVTCTKSSNNVTFVSSVWGVKFEVMLSNVLNSPSFKPNSQFYIQFTNSNNYLSLSQTKTSWTNNIGSTFVTDVSTGDAYRAQDSLFRFKLTGLSGKQTYVVVKFNDLFGAFTTAPAGTTLLSPRSLRFNIINQTTSQIYITLLTPIIFGQYTFSLQTFIQLSQNNTSFIIGQSTSNLWRHSCYNTLCKSCDSSNTSKCINCYNKSISEYYIFDTSLNTCTRDCTSGSYMSSIGNVCSPCSSACKECANISTNCTSCKTQQNLFLDKTYFKCVTQCQDGYYKNMQIQQCLQCASPCQYCQNSASKCTYCVVGKFLLAYDCLIQCPKNGLYIQNLISRKCDLCNANCLTCQNSTSTCTSCNRTALLFLQSKLCVSSCKTNSFIDDQLGVCVVCKSPCNICFNSSVTCSSCLTNTSTPIWFNYGCINESSCPIGNFVNKVKNSCDACPSQCTSCQTINSCKACTVNFTLYQGSCLSSCPNTTYSQNRVCLPCTGCSTCVGNYTNCTSCISSQFLLNGKCLASCPNGTFQNQATKACDFCLADCPTCRNTTFCLTCVGGLYLYAGKCNAQCPASTFPTTANNSMKVCEPCPTTCEQCTSFSSCQKCKPTYNLQNDSFCVTTCSQGIAYNQICYPCGLNCANCNTNTQQCELCDSNYFIYEGKCLQNCPSNTLSLNNISCVSCTVKFGFKCTTCSYSQCLSCSEGQLTSGQCQPCPQGTYSRASKCAKCPSECHSCFNQTNCIACLSGYYLQNNLCTNTCPINKIPNGTVCTVCMQHCSICNQASSLCSVCNSGFYLYESRCLSSCIQPYVINLQGKKCVTQQQFYEQYSKQARIVYFPFSIGGGILFLIGIALKCYSKLTHLITFSAAVISVAEIGAWATFSYIEYTSWSNFHNPALKGLALTLAGIGLLFIIALVHIKFYCKYFTTDSWFLKWQKSNFCIDKFFLSLSILLSFKIYRIVHSRLLEREQFSMKLTAVNKLLPFSLLSIVSLVVCSLPVAVGASLALYFSITQDQEFFAALDCLIITSIMIILMLMDLRHESTYFVIELESQNLKRQIYEQDSFKLSVNGQNYNPLDEKNMSKNQLLSEVQGHLAQQSAMKLKGRSELITTGFNKTQGVNQLQKESSKPEQQVEQVNIDSQQIDFEQISQTGDQGLRHCQNSQEQLISEQESQVKEQGAKWVQKRFDRHGFTLKTNQLGQVQRYDQNGYRVQIDDQGVQRKYDKDGNQVEQFQGQFCIKDKDGYFLKDGKRYDRRGYEIKTNSEGQHQFFDQHGFRVVQGQDGQIKLCDEFGHQVIKDQQGNVHRFTQDGYEAFISDSGKITYKDKQGNHIRKNNEGQAEMYDPEDGFKIVRGQNGQILKYDKLGYRIQKDKWGNIYRYDKDGYRIVLGPGNKVSKLNKDGYEVIQEQNGQVRLYNKEGYQVRTDQNGKKRLYDSNGYQVIKDYDGQITLYDSKGYLVTIDQQTGQHSKFTSQGLRVVQHKDGTTKFYDKRNHEVVQLQGGYYEKYDQLGNKIDLDLFGFQVATNQNGEQIRYDKVGNVVDEELFQEKLIEQQMIMQKEGEKAIRKILRFKAKNEIDLEGEYQKMLQQQKQNFRDQESLQQQPNLHEFHNPQIYKQENLNEQYEYLKNYEQKIQVIQEDDHLNLDQLQQVDHYPQKDLKQKQTKILAVRRNNKFQSGDAIEGDLNQDYIELKSIADASIDERSFENQGVHPIQIDDSQYSELQSLDQLSPNLAKRGKRKRGQHSQISIMEGQNNDTKTQYKHKKVNVQIKNKKIYDENDQIQSLNEENWAQNAQGGMFYNYNKDLSNANTNTNVNQLIYMDDVEDQTDTLSSFVKQNTNRSKRSPRQMNGRYDYDKNTIQQMQNELFQRQMDEGIRQRTEFKLTNGPNPLVQYAKQLQSNKKSIQQRTYFEETKKKKRRR